jgi:hypothetical protein
MNISGNYDSTYIINYSAQFKKHHTSQRDIRQNIAIASHLAGNPAESGNVCCIRVLSRMLPPGEKIRENS